MKTEYILDFLKLEVRVFPPNRVYGLKSDLSSSCGITLPGNPSAWVVSDGKIGDEVQCFGLAAALGLSPERRLVTPRSFYAILAPFGPIDSRHHPDCINSPIMPPFPDILIAAGRRTVPYLRHVKKASSGRTFTVFMKDPYTGSKTADVLCLPLHDKLRGENVVVAMTSPHRLTQSQFVEAREKPDCRFTYLPYPRLAMILGGVSGHYEFTDADTEKLGAIAVKHALEGYGVMITPSRRTPVALLEGIRQALAATHLLDQQAYVWDRAGQNPYVDMLAHADAIIVTGDSVNMCGEATSTGKPVYIYTPSGRGHPKMTAFIDRLEKVGAVRRYQGRIDYFTYETVDSTPFFAREVATRFFRFLNRGDFVTR